MQQNPSSQNVQKEKKDYSRRDEILRILKSLLLENWGTKLLAILIAVALWAGLITQDPKLTREKQFTDVSVNIIGSDTLRRNGFIVLDDISSAFEDVTVRVDVPQGQYANAQASNYSLRVDLSRITEAGEQSVKILSTNSSTYGTVTEIIPSSVLLTVDEYVTRYRIPVTVVTEGDAPEGFFADTPSTDPPMVAVSGPKTLVDRIVSAQVVVDQSTLPAEEGSVRRALSFSMVDANSEVIQSDMLQVTSESVLLDSIIVDQSIYAKRAVDMSDVGLVTGKPAEGYEIKGVYISPSSVVVAGRQEVIEDLDLLYANNTVDVNGRTESINKILWLRTPTTIKYASTDVVTVAVEIGPIMTGRAYVSQIKLQNLPYHLMETSGMQAATVYISGAQYWLDDLSSSEINIFCDLSNISSPGIYDVPLNCVVHGGEGQNYTCDIMPESVTVTIEQR